MFLVVRMRRLYLLNRATVRAGQEGSAVMLSAAKHLEAQRTRPFAAAQGETKERVAGKILVKALFVAILSC